MPKDNDGIEETEENATELRGTRFTNPEGGYCEHHPDGDT
jgi:hypothetical protein